MSPYRELAEDLLAVVPESVLSRLLDQHGLILSELKQSPEASDEERAQQNDLVELIERAYEQRCDSPPKKQL